MPRPASTAAPTAEEMEGEGAGEVAEVAEEEAAEAEEPGEAEEAGEAESE